MDQFPPPPPPAAAAFKRTIVSLGLQLGQFMCSLSSFLFLCWVEDTNGHYPFWFWSLVRSMGGVLSWSLVLALMDAYSVVFRRPYHREVGLLCMINAADWVLSFMALGVASTTTAVANYMNERLQLHAYMQFCGEKDCNIILLSASMAFLTSFLLFASSLFGLWNLRRLPSP